MPWGPPSPTSSSGVLVFQDEPGTFDRFGLDLIGYLPQPGSYFQVNRFGFDTGVRRFLVNTDVADLGAFPPGTADFKYSRMFVNRLTNEVVGGPWTMVTVDYLGMMFDKPTEYMIDTDVRRTSIAVSFFIFPFDVSEVTVQATYITPNEPDLNAPGQALTPDIFIPPPTSANAIFFNIQLPVLLWQWVLRKRAVRIAGIASSNNSATWIAPHGNVEFNLPANTMSGGALSCQFTTELYPGDRLLVFTTSSFVNIYNFPTGDVYPYSTPLLGQTSLHVAQYLDVLSSQSGIPAAIIFAKFGFRFTNAFAVGIRSIIDSNHATLFATTFPVWASMDYTTTDFWKYGVVNTTTQGSPSALWEVTDTYKRVVAVEGETWAQAFGQ